MCELDAAILLVELFSDYERYAVKLSYNVNHDYSKAIAMAIMALEKSNNT